MKIIKTIVYLCAYPLAFLFFLALYAPPLSYKNLALIQGIVQQGKKVQSEYSLAAGKAYLAWFEGAYRFGQKDSPTIQLLNEPRIGILNLNGPTLRATQSKGNPAYVLQGPVAGKLLYGVATRKIFDDAYKAELISFWRDYYKKQLPKDNLSAKRIDDLLTVVRRSLEESQAEHSLYFPSITRSILLGHQMLKDQPLENIIEMYKELLSLGVTDFTLAGHADSLFSDLQLEKFKEHIENIPTPEKKAELLLQSPELTLATDAYLQENTLNLPAAPIQGQFCYKGSPSAPNCVETLLHDLVDLLVFDTTSRSFNPEKMLPCVRLNSEVISFYQHHPETDFMSVNNARQDWFNLLSGLPAIVYNKPEGYDMKASFNNILMALNHIFTTQAKTLEELGQLLSTPGHIITFSLEDRAPDAKEVKCRVTIEGLLGYFEIHVLERHGYMTRSVDETLQSFFNDSINRSILSDDDLEGRETVLPLVLKTKGVHPYLLRDTALATYVSYNLHNPDELSASIYRLMRHISHENTSKRSIKIAQEVLSLLEKMPTTDTNFALIALEYAFELKASLLEYNALHKRIDTFLIPLVKKYPLEALCDFLNVSKIHDVAVLVSYFEKYGVNMDEVIKRDTINALFKICNTIGELDFNVIIQFFERYIDNRKLWLQKIRENAYLRNAFISQFERAIRPLFLMMHDDLLENGSDVEYENKMLIAKPLYHDLRDLYKELKNQYKAT